MKIFKLISYTDIKEILEDLPNEFKLDLNDCMKSQRVRVIDFFSGLAYREGSMKKISTLEYIITLKGGK